MKKLAFCLVLLGLGTMVFAGCAQEEKAATTPAATSTDTADEGSADAPAAPAADEGAPEGGE